MIAGEIFERNAKCFGPLPAVIFEGRTITHAELGSRIRRLINALCALGCKRQDRIAVLSRNCPEYLEVYGAAALGGFVGTGINYRLGLAEQIQVVRDAEPAVLVFEPESLEAAAALREHLPASTHFICIGPACAWAMSYEELLAGSTVADPSIRATETDTLFLVYTSGTTGTAKGVMIGNGSWVEQTTIVGMVQGCSPLDRMLIVMPFYHMGGPAQAFPYLAAGACLVMHRSFDAAAVMQSIQDLKVTAAHLAPTMIQMMLDRQAHAPGDISSLHTVCYASAPMSVALSRRAAAVFGSIFVQMYGMTELGLGCALLKHQHIMDGPEGMVKRLASAGQPFLGTDLSIVRDDQVPCKPNEVGNILIRSSTVMQGYWKRPELTREVIDAEGFLRTGDVGYVDDECFLFIVDRRKDMIISGGENIYSREVEEALLQHPAIAEAAVVGVPDAKWGESVMAFVVFKPGASAAPEEIVAHCRNLIASYKKPRFITVLTEMPRVSSTNKIDKRALRQPFWAGAERQVI